MNFSTPQRKKDTRPQPSALSVRILLCRYLRAVPEGDRDFLVPAHRDELDHAAPKAAVKVCDGAVKKPQTTKLFVKSPIALVRWRVVSPFVSPMACSSAFQIV